jgi:threonine synthase
LAGYLAQQMGLPIEQLILATNENDILTRFFNTGVYGKATVVPTISPSMDIQVASNFERYLFYQMDQDGDRVRAMMNQFSQEERLEVSVGENGVVDPLFIAGRGTKAETLEVIKRYQAQFDYLLDPHTAVGVWVAEQHPASVPTICLATAHPAKFTQTMEQALGCSVHHPILDALEGAPTRCDSIANDRDAVQQYLVEHI